MLEHSPVRENKEFSIKKITNEDSPFEIAVMHRRYYAVDKLYDIDQKMALKILYKRIEEEKDREFKERWNGYLVWISYRPLLHFWNSKNNLIGNTPPHIMREIMKYY